MLAACFLFFGRFWSFPLASAKHFPLPGGDRGCRRGHKLFLGSQWLLELRPAPRATRAVRDGVCGVLSRILGRFVLFPYGSQLRGLPVAGPGAALWESFPFLELGGGLAPGAVRALVLALKAQIPVIFLYGAEALFKIAPFATGGPHFAAVLAGAIRFRTATRAVVTSVVSRVLCSSPKIGSALPHFWNGRKGRRAWSSSKHRRLRLDLHALRSHGTSNAFLCAIRIALFPKQFFTRRATALAHGTSRVQSAVAVAHFCLAVPTALASWHDDPVNFYGPFVPACCGAKHGGAEIFQGRLPGSEIVAT